MYITDQDFHPTGTLISFFEQYTALKGDQITEHILKIRAKAWELYTYPCIGNFYFVEFTFANQPVYQEVLGKLQQGASFLDVGCCFGQDLRKLVADGAPAGKLNGMDLRPEFIELGYELFCDRGTLPARFIAPADILALAEAANDDAVRLLSGKIDIIHLGHFLHLFSWKDQLRAATNIAKLLSPAKGSLIVGHQVGSEVAGEFALPWVPESDEDSPRAFRHHEASFKKLWEQVPGDWEVEFAFASRPKSLGRDPRDLIFEDSPHKLFVFTVKRA
ncbi:hypothetical protein L873DRAFT_1663949 [Choiromyces venosus 120613-1]|uniref:Methyltransferase type 11 domain-containing protein n=1 Tax=Choiromyces venosus 120613-1 TaxID=1336337 RepID=A0A3N4K3H1_9PEZI|nr:hypothetical protein L873DRAFT_1663949 [Choiromyces venosus 120613-1]